MEIRGGEKKKDLYLRTSDIELCTIQILRHRLSIILMTSVTVKKWSFGRNM